jgi:hypothetical protein
MIKEDKRKQIKEIWDNYIASNQIVLDTKGNVLDAIDSKRLDAIKNIKSIINGFQKNELNIFEFKSSLDSYNKRNNLWGFTTTKGQMFFNQLVKVNENSIDNLTILLKNVINEPTDIFDALEKIEKLEKFTEKTFRSAVDKRKAPNPGSVGYFLSYFWQVHNYAKWPILYTSLQNAFVEIGIWDSLPTQRESYSFFFNLNEEIKAVLSEHTKKNINNWEAEHAFWNFKGNPNKTVPKKSKIKEVDGELTPIALNASFEIKEYLIPRVAHLTEIGNQKEKSASAKGSEYEKLVSEIKRFILITSEALLYLLAHKTKDKLSLNLIIEKLIGIGNHVTSEDIIQEFDDV